MTSRRANDRGLDHPTAEELLVRRQISCLLEALEAVPDPRDPRGVRFDLPLLLGLAVFAACCGAATFDEVAEVVADLPDLLAAGFGLVRTPPSAATFRRIINATDPTALDEALSVWAAGPAARAAGESTTTGQARPTVGGVSLDGKTMRGAKMFDAAGAMTQVAVLEALDHDTGSVLGQVQVLGNDEPAAARALIRRLAARPGGLAGVVVILDAKHTTRELADLVISLGGHYVLTVKGNAPTLLARIKDVPWPQVPLGHVTRDKGHDRVETRTIKVCQLATGLPLAGVVQVARLGRTTFRKKSATTPKAWTRESVHIVTSLPPDLADPVRLADLVRSHWRVEALHWQRDVVFNEDRHTARTGHGPVNLACLRNTAITRHGRADSTELAPALRACNRHPERALAIIAK